MSSFNIVMKSEEQTVVTEYVPVQSKSAEYQGEGELERKFIELLEGQSYDYLPIKSEKDLIDNLRTKLEELNKTKFSDREWETLFNTSVAKPNDAIEDKSELIQENYIQILKRDDGTSKNIYLINKSNIHENKLQVINQYAVEGKRKNRYDVTILVNGLPLVHVELKRRGVAIREAFNQIERYQEDSFWAGCGLYQYIQIFVISNGTFTKYYSNTTRFNQIKEKKKHERKEKTSNSFEFTSYWADANNKVIPDLVDFTKTFFSKHTLLNILTKYCVFTSGKMLLVMRPYQIAATERILNKIEIARNYKMYGSVEAGGYIWHATGSGKTLTSFKSARLASSLAHLDKVLFVVDRKDLDYQTMKEYDRFEKDAANSNKNTAILKKQLEDPKSKIIITTIQKLSNFIKQNRDHEVYQKEIVLIFDECHRSQFGLMHAEIKKKFKKYYIFGFTGTPIFAANSSSNGKNFLRTTELAFGDKLHSYTIVDAINDHNVLPFRIDYIKTFEGDENIDDEQVWDIDRENILMDPKRVSLIAEYIYNHFDQKTYRNKKYYNFSSTVNINEVIKNRNETEEKKQKLRLSGFNSIFAVSSIDAAKVYYTEFKKQNKLRPNEALKVAVIYSYGVNEDDTNGLIDDENSESAEMLDQSSRDFLDNAIGDYNEMFQTNYDTSGRFENYYKDVSLRMKNREIDLLIVVNMFLTGFDATTLNTLWVDKNLKMHGLIQAYSRTNRILNSVKTFGNIVCFRNLQKRTDDAVALFGDKNASGIIVLRGFKDYYYGYTDSTGKEVPGYVDYINDLKIKFPLSETLIVGEKNQKEFIRLYGVILRMKNLLRSFDEFEGEEILSEREFQDYDSIYLNLRDELRPVNREVEEVNDDIVFEIELLKQVEVNIDYILMLVQKYHDTHCKDQEVLITIRKAIDSSPDLRSKKNLIETFVLGVNDIDDVMSSWRVYLAEEKEKQLREIIESEKLKEDETKLFVSNCFENGAVKTIGTDLDKILPPVSRFGGGNRDAKKKRVIEKLIDFFERFYGL